MKDRRKRWARLLPDYRTLYLTLDEMDDHRRPGENDADLLLRNISYARDAVEKDGARRLLAYDLLARAGLPPHDALGLELAKAMVARARFLEEHPQMAMAIGEPVDGNGDGDRQGRQ